MKEVVPSRGVDVDKPQVPLEELDLPGVPGLTEFSQTNHFLNQLLLLGNPDRPGKE
jgi:hypothetical protein